MAEVQSARILVADDDEGIRFMISEIMKKEGYAVDLAEDGDEAIEKAIGQDYEVVILDVRMPGRDGMEALREVKKRKPGSIVVMITAHGTQQLALDAIRIGAYDYFSKPFELEEFRIVIRRALEKHHLESELRRLQTQLVAGQTFGKFIGQCEAMKRVYEMIGNVAPSDVTVLIRGESGTGKELVAKEIHERSTRKGKPFVSINCAAIPESLLESELFGHERGAFTGAVAAKPGRFELADGGTIFLDEIGDMPLALQAKLLRVLQEREIERVGGTRVISVDIRVLAATNQDLEQAVGANAFREDLFFRLNVIPLHLPPLRERIDDIPLLTQHFIDRFNAEFGKHVTGVDDEALKAFVRYRWPGNVREMENSIQRAVVLASGDVLQVADLPEAVSADAAAVRPGQGSPGADDAVLSDFSKPLADKVASMTDSVERRAIELALKETGGKREETAKLLGLSRKSLYNKMRKFGMKED